MTTRPDSHEIPGAWATPGNSGDPQLAHARVAAMVARFTDVSDLMVSVADLKALLRINDAVRSAVVTELRSLVHEMQHRTVDIEDVEARIKQIGEGQS